MKTLTTLLAIAVIAPSTALAGGPIVWHHVSDNRADDVSNHVEYTADARADVMDHEFALERRDAQIDDARADVKAAKSIRKDMRKANRTAKRDLRKAKRQDLNLTAFTANAGNAQRDLLEARDFVDLQRARVDVKKSHHHLEEGRLARAKANLELTQSRMLAQSEDATATPKKRFVRQLDRITRRTAERRADWDLARVDLQERRQDHWMNQTVVTNVYSVFPGFRPVSTVPMMDQQSDGDTASLRRVHFELGSADLDTAALNDLAWNAHVLRNHRSAAVRVEGHTDATGSMALNRELAWDRAQTIEDFLVEQGVWDSQIETAAYGETRPLVNTTEATVANRRGEFRVLSSDAMVDGSIDDAWQDDFDLDYYNR